MQYLIIGLIGILALTSAILGFISVAKSTSFRSMLVVASLLTLLSVIIVGLRLFYSDGRLGDALTLLSAIFMLTAGIIFAIGVGRVVGKTMVIVATVAVFSALIVLGGDYAFQWFSSPEKIAPSVATQPFQTSPSSLF